MDLKPNITSSPHNYWFYLNLIYASHCQRNFPNVNKTHGVNVHSKSCLICLHSIFKVQVFAKRMDSVIYSYNTILSFDPLVAVKTFKGR